MPDHASRPLRVFLCHSSDDKATVRELYETLNRESWIDPWLDEEKLLPGQDWDDEIKKALNNSDAVIVTLSTGSVSKEGYVQKEVKFILDIALEKPEDTIFILPVRLDECERPRRLQPIHGVDYFPPERRELARAKLLRSLELRANALGIPTQIAGSKSESEISVPPPKKSKQGQLRIVLSFSPHVVAGVAIKLDGEWLHIPDTSERKGKERVEIFNQLVAVGVHKIYAMWAWNDKSSEKYQLDESFLVSDEGTTLVTLSQKPRFWSREVWEFSIQ